MLESDHQLSFSNAGPEPLLVWLEPWAEEFVVAPRSSISLCPPLGSELGELEQTCDHLVLWANARTVKVFIDGILQDTGSASSPIPDGLTKKTLGVVFAGQPECRLGGTDIDPNPRHLFGSG